MKQVICMAVCFILAGCSNYNQPDQSVSDSGYIRSTHHMDYDYEIVSVEGHRILVVHGENLSVMELTTTTAEANGLDAK